MKKDNNSQDNEKLWRQRYEESSRETEELEKNFPKIGSGKKYDEYGGRLMTLQGITARINILSSLGDIPSILDLDKPSSDLMTRQDDLMKRYIRMRKR